MPNGSPRPHPGEQVRPRLGRRVVVVLLVLAAAIASTPSLVPYDQLKDVDAFTVDRDADVTREEFDGIVLASPRARDRVRRARGGLVAFGRTIDRTTDGVARAWWSALRTAPTSRLRTWAGRETRSYLVCGGCDSRRRCCGRIAYLDVPLRYDEATTYNNFVSKPLYVAPANYATPNNHLLHTFSRRGLGRRVRQRGLGDPASGARRGDRARPGDVRTRTRSLRPGRGAARRRVRRRLLHTGRVLDERPWVHARGAPRCSSSSPPHVPSSRASVGAWAVVAVVGAIGLYAVPVMIYPLGGALLWILVTGIPSAGPSDHS